MQLQMKVVIYMKRFYYAHLFIVMNYFICSILLLVFLMLSHKIQNQLDEYNSVM